MSKIILYSNEYDLTKYKSFKKIPTFKYYWVINLYLGKSKYFPHFDKIYVLHEDYELESIQMIYNMLNINGKLYLKQVDKYKNYFKKYKNIEDFYIVKKKNNFQYIIPSYRIIDFIICGVQLSLDELITYNLAKHPDININTDSDPKTSQAHFFDINWQNGVDFYKSYFDYSKKIVGERTASLLYLKYTYPLMYSMNPHVKLIIILFNPVHRAFKHWIMAKTVWNYQKTFEEAIEEELNNKFDIVNFYTASTHFIKKGFYFEQITELFKYFPRYNVLIVIEEDIFKNKKQEFEKIFTFLNADYTKMTDIFINENRIDNKKNYKMDENTYNKLINIYKDDILNLERLLNIKTNWI